MAAGHLILNMDRLMTLDEKGLNPFYISPTETSEKEAGYTIRQHTPANQASPKNFTQSLYGDTCLFFIILKYLIT